MCVHLCCTASILVGDIEKEFSQFFFLFEDRFVDVRMSCWIFAMIWIVVRGLGSLLYGATAVAAITVADYSRDVNFFHSNASPSSQITSYGGAREQ